MIHSKDPCKVVKNTYSENVIENIDFGYLKNIFEKFTYENCKVLLNCNDLLSKRVHLVKTEPVSEMLKEKWFNTKYRIYTKPHNPQSAFESREEWNKITSALAEPKKNEFIPEDISTITNANE